MKNYSRQREAILSALRSTDTHPTAADVYKMVKQIIPNISLGSVYRNLSELSAAGEILSISVGDGTEHFDGDNSAHLHLHCNMCGSITDARFEDAEIQRSARAENFEPQCVVCVVYGICDSCKNSFEKADGESDKSPSAEIN